MSIDKLTLLGFVTNTEKGSDKLTRHLADYFVSCIAHFEVPDRASAEIADYFARCDWVEP